MQAQEKKVERLIGKVHKLGTIGAPLAEREEAAQLTIQAIQDTCSFCFRLDTQVGVRYDIMKCSSPHMSE